MPRMILWLAVRILRISEQPRNPSWIRLSSCVAVCCSVLQQRMPTCPLLPPCDALRYSVAACCSVYQQGSPEYSVIHRVLPCALCNSEGFLHGVVSAVCCSVSQCVAVCCRVLQCVAVCCSVLPCVPARDSFMATSSNRMNARRSNILRIGCIESANILKSQRQRHLIWHSQLWRRQHRISWRCLISFKFWKLSMYDKT